MNQNYHHLSLEERALLDRLHFHERIPVRQCARIMGRHKSTLYRELARNRWFASNENESYRPYRPARLKTGPWTSPPFWASATAQRRAARRAHRARRPRALSDDLLVSYVADGLRKGWSPERIAGRLRLDHPDEPDMRACHETIYRWIYTQRRDQIQYLLRAHKRRRRRGGPKAHAPRIPGRIPIGARPSYIDDRSTFGHWESDTVIGGTASKTCLDTQVERRTRFLMARLIPDKTAPSTAEAELDMYSKLPAGARLSRTWDNGTEAALRQRVDDRLGMTTFFAEPYSSWQRGTNENRNGMIRRYLPKRTDFSQLTGRELQDIVDEINDMPMKVLGWKTPRECFEQELARL